GETGVALVPLSPAQQKALSHRGVARVLPPGLFAGSSSYQGLLVVDGQQPRSGPLPFEDRVLDFECEEVLAHAGSVSLCRGWLRVPSALTPPAWHWVGLEQPRAPPLLARSARLRLTGDLPGWQPLPYRLTCVVESLGWSWDVELDRHGPFCVSLDLPAAAVGR